MTNIFITDDEFKSVTDQENHAKSSETDCSCLLACGFLVEAPGATYTYLPTETYARLRKGELEACGFNNITITPLYRKR